MINLTKAVVRELAPSGVLRVAINLANFLLVSGKNDNGDPIGVAPDLAAAIAKDLNVELQYIGFDRPGELADAVVKGVWDIGLIGVEPDRARHIDFTAAYVEIEATYLVAGNSKIRTIADVDNVGVRIAVAARSAYDLYLSRHLQHAQLVRASGLEESYQLFVSEDLDALAGLKPRLLSDVKRIENARLLDDRFTAVQQAIGTPVGRVVGFAYLREYVENAKESGMIADLIGRYKIDGLSVAPSEQTIA
jgi:polar amino acid transport system substrate-binding protein